MPNHNAVFDTLYLLNELEKPLNGLSRVDIFRLAYLGCLLNLFQNNPLSAWGYSFILTKDGQLFCRELESGIDELISIGAISSENNINHIEITGKDLLAGFSALQMYAARIRNLSIACSSLIVLPHTSLIKAFQQEPNIKSAQLHNQDQYLLGDSSPSMTVMYEHFHSLNQILGDKTKELLLPSVVWLQYLAENQQDNVGSREAANA